MLDAVVLSTTYRDAQGHFAKSLVTTAGRELYMAWCKKTTHDVLDPDVSMDGGSGEMLAEAASIEVSEADGFKEEADYYKQRLKDILVHTPSPPKRARLTPKSRGIRDFFVAPLAVVVPQPSRRRIINVPEGMRVINGRFLVPSEA